MAEKNSNFQLIRQSVRDTHLAVFPSTRKAAGGPESAESSALGQAEENGGNAAAVWATSYEQSVAKAIQSIGQTTAIVIQDAADMLRNVSTVEVTAIGAATAKWIATTDPQYKDIIEESINVINQAAAAYLTIGQNAYTVLSKFQS